MIVQELHEIQHRCGYLPVEELQALARRLEVPLHRLHEVASCFPHYRLEPPPAVEVGVCRDMACHLRGAGRLRVALTALASEIGGDAVEVGGVSCLGQCDHAPAVAVNGHIYWGLSEGQVRARVRDAAEGKTLPHQKADRSPRGWTIDPYDGQPRYDAVRRLVETRDAASVIEALKLANLRGMGGAGFPTHLKWSTVRSAPGDVKYVVCNGDESEPGTFKDRELLRRTPHLLVEGMVLAGLVTGAQRGYIYLRHEYEQEIEVMREAIAAAAAQGLCGERILGSDLGFPLEVFVSPGGYICGEESALLEAMEDRRAEPRNKPPFPVFSGLRGQPTVINNVETLCWTPAIVLRGGAWYRDAGVRGASGLRFVSISGDVNDPGVYEVPFGQTVRELIQTAGGMRDGQALKAIAPSGPSGGFLPAVLHEKDLPTTAARAFFRDRLARGGGPLDILDLPLDLATLGGIGNMLGAAFVVVGERACIVDFARNCVAFYRNESCGKCVPCRVGTQKLLDILTDITSGSDGRDGMGAVDDLAYTMAQASICGLGQVAANPMTTVMGYFRAELAEHVERGRCPAGVCFSR
ncbi:MAG TPA: NADH-ubiquinone oxidoreductase-F iron-sulfur binding region domain-containing protein [Isosphaeraceae bacterium]